MSAKAKPTTCAVTSCCASRSPSAPSPAPSPPPSRELAHRPALQQAGQEADPCNQGVPPLPGFEANIGLCMPVDLPRDVIGAAGEGEGRLGKAQNGQRFALPLHALPPTRRSVAPHERRRVPDDLQRA